MVVDFVDGTLLHDPALFHDKHPVTKLVDDVEIVRDKEIAQVQFLTQVAQKLQDLRLDRHVQCRDRLVRDDKARSSDEGRCDAHSLSLSAGELRGPGVEALFGQLYFGQHVAHAALPLCLVIFAKNAKRLFQRPLDRIGRIQGTVWVLKDDLGALCVVDDRAFFRFDHTQDHSGEGGFSGAAFSDKPHDLTVADIEVHVVENLLILASSKESGRVVASAHVIHFQNQLILRLSLCRGIRTDPCYGGQRAFDISHCAHLLPLRCFPPVCC